MLDAQGGGRAAASSSLEVELLTPTMKQAEDTSADLASSTAVRGLSRSEGGGSNCTMLRDCPGSFTNVGTIAGTSAEHNVVMCQDIPRH